MVPQSTVQGPQGRSPRERGSQASWARNLVSAGSIPAGAGEPPWRCPARAQRRVDPRGSGGASGTDIVLGTTTGRSPRERGSRRTAVCRAGQAGSIPAGAGEPRRALARCWPCGVDPRGSGGAHDQVPAIGPVVGRSPRERGSPRYRRRSSGRPGSIPAGAGEPNRGPGMSDPPGVDPRGSGGAEANRPAAAYGPGRSPRERGSLLESSVRNTVNGSIPAGAGEPNIGFYTATCPRVDPRGSGGAELRG